MSANTDPLPVEPANRYFYRRHLTGRDLLPAIGAGVAIGLLGYYVARLLIEREPLVPDGPGSAGERRRWSRRTPGSG
jgi:hypothetical protein